MPIETTRATTHERATYAVDDRGGESERGMRIYGLVAAAAAAVGAIAEIIRLAVEGAPLAPFSALLQAILSTVFIALLAVSALGLAVHRSFGWIGGVVGMLAALTYGSVLEAAKHHWGVLYVAVAIVMFVGLVKSLHFFRTDLRVGSTLA
jgi:hypothetical protein